MLKRVVYTFLLVLWLAVLISVHAIFFLMYISVNEVYSNGERVSAEVRSVVSRASGGRRFSTYKFYINGQEKDLYLKDRLNVGEKLNLVISTKNKSRVFKVKNFGSWVEIHNGVTGGLFTNILMSIIHLAFIYVIVKQLTIIAKGVYRNRKHIISITSFWDQIINSFIQTFDSGK